MCVPKYSPEWPTLGRVKSVHGREVELQWYTGPRGSPGTVHSKWVPGRAPSGKRELEWERVGADYIYFTFPKLTPSQKLPGIAIKAARANKDRH